MYKQIRIDRQYKSKWMDDSTEFAVKYDGGTKENPRIWMKYHISDGM